MLYPWVNQDWPEAMLEKNVAGQIKLKAGYTATEITDDFRSKAVITVVVNPLFVIIAPFL